MVATCSNWTREVPVELKSLITSISLFSLWILSEVKTRCCCFLDCVLLLHFAKHRFSSKRVRNPRISCQNSFLALRNKQGCPFKLVVTQVVPLTLLVCIRILPYLNYCFPNAAQIYGAPARKQAGKMSLFRAF